MCNRDGKFVALKRLRIENEKEGFPITAIREIKLLKYLNHPNVISLHGMAIRKGIKSDDKGEIYMVFPYMEHDLAGLIENPKVSFDLPLIKSYTQQLLRGMHYLHERDILHRDLKSANLLISNRGELKIGDFGLAREIGEQEAHPLTVLVVTRWYRPPELLLGAQTYDSAIDMWGVGCIIAEMLKRKPIFQSNSEMDQIDRIFQVCGTPNDTCWPSWRSLPFCSNISKMKEYQRQVKNTVKTYIEPPMEHDVLMLDMIDRLLVLDPGKRLSAADALSDPWFTTQPLPYRPEEIPHLAEESHELDARRLREVGARGSGATSGMASGKPSDTAQHSHHQHDNRPSSRNGGTYPSRQHYGDHARYDDPGGRDTWSNHRRKTYDGRGHEDRGRGVAPGPVYSSSSSTMRHSASSHPYRRPQSDQRNGAEYGQYNSSHGDSFSQSYRRSNGHYHHTQHPYSPIDIDRRLTQSRPYIPRSEPRSVVPLPPAPASASVPSDTAVPASERSPGAATAATEAPTPRQEKQWTHQLPQRPSDRPPPLHHPVHRM
ncbi:serine/threonine protein kinase, CMGC, CDC2/CDK subfamily [Sorochytrium milnesiophthora]